MEKTSFLDAVKNASLNLTIDGIALYSAGENNFLIDDNDKIYIHCVLVEGDKWLGSYGLHYQVIGADIYSYVLEVLEKKEILKKV